ncbi:response regulator [Chthoniobacter flavus]|nr:response regulator [Chthoniobacter flavus]
MSISPLTGPSLTAPSSTTEVHRQTILVVDDDVALRGTMSMMLECDGFRVLGAGNGLEALQMLEGNSHISAVLLDLFMPVMGGRETLHQIRSFWSSLPVILVSGYDMSELDQDPKTAPDGYIHKPFTFTHLTSTLGAVLH